MNELKTNEENNVQLIKGLTRSISYGMYLVTTKDGDILNGQICDSLTQVSTGTKISVNIHKDNYTMELLKKSKVLGIHVLNESSMEYIGTFGFQSGRDIEKFADINYEIGKLGVPLLTESVSFVGEAKLVDYIEVDSHYIVILDLIVGYEPLDALKPITYEEYRILKKGGTIHPYQ